MATIKKGILGGFSGKVGNVVGASWKGVAYIRSLPSNVRNPRSEKQLTQRSKFSLAAKFVLANLPVIRIGFRRSAGSENSAFAAAVAYNVSNAVKGSYPDFEIDYPKAALSRGSLYGGYNATAAYKDGILKFEWDSTIISNASPNDRVMMIAYNPATQVSICNLDAATRSEGTAMLVLPSVWEGSKVETFMVFISEVGAMTSPTIYTGSHDVLND